MKTKYVVGCPAWDRAWSLDLWFQSVKANVPPDETGLVFVIPADDQLTRDVINEHAKDFLWLEVERDRGEQFDRALRADDDNHTSLAVARNQILRIVNQAKPDLFLSWDSDLLLSPGTVEEVERVDRPISTVWTWLNRQKPQTLTHVNPQTGSVRYVQWQEPVAATAMRWESMNRPAHLRAEHWAEIVNRGWFLADVVLAFQMMQPLVYQTTSYAPNRYGEEIPFNMSLERRSIPRYCYSAQPGIHLYRRDPEELEMGWPDICDLAEELPLAVSYTDRRDDLDIALGFYPMESEARDEGNDSRIESGRALERSQRDAARSDQSERARRQPTAA